MGEETIEGILGSLGLSDREAELYLFLAKHGVLKCGEIAKGMKRHTAQIYRLMKTLMSKGLVEATLETPARFAVVPLETVIDQHVKTKRDEAALIESTRNEVLTYWKSIQKPILEAFSEKFMVIEGNSKIYAKISQMVKEARNQLSTVTTAAGISRAEQFGVFDVASEHPLNSKVQFRLLTELSSQNVKAVRALLRRIPTTKINFKVRNLNLGLKVLPQMMMRDEDETLFFITPKPTAPVLGKDDVCLWTNCKALVQAFSMVFEDLWRNSTEIEEKLVELEAGGAAPTVHAGWDAEMTKKKYEKAMRSAREKILMLTTSEGLTELYSKPLHLKKHAAKGVSVKIMAPIVKENWEAAKQLSKFCAVRHVPTNYLATTIVDGKHLFQFRSQDQDESEPIERFDNVFHSADRGYVEMMQTALNNIWENSQEPSTITLESIIGASNGPAAFPLPINDQLNQMLGNVTVIDVKPPGTITETDVLSKIINANRIAAANPAKDVSRRYASVGVALIHPHSCFGLPDMMIEAVHAYKQSSFGPDEYIVVYLWLETPKGHAYVPVAVMGEPLNAQEIMRRAYEGTPAANNIQLVKKDEIEVRVHGNIFFAGWTVPIKLFPDQLILPPGCILIEGYGGVKTRAYTILTSAGFRHTIETNYFDALLTFIHPSSKYSGPGTDALFCRDHILTRYPP